MKKLVVLRAFFMPKISHEKTVKKRCFWFWVDSWVDSWVGNGR